MFKSSVKRKLTNTSDEIKKVQHELDILDEQVVYFDGIADENRLRALVSETPMAEKEYNESRRTLEALIRDQDVHLAKLVKLEQRQNELLDKLSGLK